MPEPPKPEVAKRGDHPWVDALSDEQKDADVHLAKSVYEAEIEAIKKRRQYVKTQAIKPRNRDGCSHTGIALSGGGIRSASFALGALQAFHQHSGIEGIDYLSTVSGGGYIGCSLTAAMQKTKGEFPFAIRDGSKAYADTDSVHHIRDFSNYLIPHGAEDIVTALTLIGRGLVANILIILPVLLLCVFFTLAYIFVGNLFICIADRVCVSDPLWGLHSFRLTAIIFVASLLFLMIWAIDTSIAHRIIIRGGWLGVSKIFFVATLATAFIELQPFILWAMFTGSASPAEASASSDQIVKIGWLGLLWALWARAKAYLAFTAASPAFVFLSKYLGDVVASARHAEGWTAWIKKTVAMTALWIGAIIIPVFLWLMCLWLTVIGLKGNWSLWLWLVAFGILSVGAAVIIDPNKTSLHGLYRDRLRKAFLFDPDPNNRDKKRDLSENKLKLHEIESEYCPYPIVNAALNIEASQYVNKRGRNADFFIFTPEYTGSDATGYIGTEETALELGTAMAISGAAVSSEMGSGTIKPLIFTLALLNFRLGY
jgi:hypothetical protein